MRSSGPKCSSAQLQVQTNEYEDPRKDHCYGPQSFHAANKGWVTRNDIIKQHSSHNETSKWRRIATKCNGVKSELIANRRSVVSSVWVLSPVVQSDVSLTSSLVVKILTVLVKTISNLREFLLKKCEKLLQMLKLLTFFFSAKILAYMPYLMIKVLTIC